MPYAEITHEQGNTAKAPAPEKADLQRNVIDMAAKVWSSLDHIKEKTEAAAAAVAEKVSQIDLPAIPRHVSAGFESLRKVDYSQVPAQFRQQVEENMPDDIPRALQSTMDQFYTIEYHELPSQAVDWIKDHPGEAAFYVANGIIFFYPALLPGKVFGLLGFTAKGPRAGSLASVLMSRFGVVPSRGAFAIVQSSQMSGYGASIVHGATRIGVVAVGSSQYLASWWYGREQKVRDVVDAGETGSETERDVEGDAALKVKANL